MLNIFFAVGIIFAATGSVYPQSPLLPKKLAIYYGWPSGVNGSAGNLDAAAAGFKNYDLVVLAFDLQDSTHPDHDKTAIIIDKLKAYSTAVYGYVYIGGERTNRPPALSISAIRGFIDAWATMGVAGIFLDEAGYDYDCDRQRQNDAVDHVHSKGLSAFINAWNPDEVFSPAVVNKVAYYPDGTLSSYDMNPQGLSAHLGPDDIYLHESFQVINNSYQDPAFWKERSDKALNYKNQFGTRMAAVTTLCTPQISVCDPPRTECNVPFDQAKFDYAWWSTLLYGFDFMGWGEANFSAGCPGEPWADSLPYRTRPDPGEIGRNFAAAQVDHGLEPVHRRTTSTGTIEVSTAAPSGKFTRNPVNGIYVWTDETSTSQDRQNLVEVCTDPAHPLGMVLLNGYDNAHGALWPAANLRAFNELAHAAGLSVYALFTDSLWVDEVLQYNASCAATNQQFDGYAMDYEGFAGGEPTTPLDIRYYDETKQRCGTLPLHVSIGWHWTNDILYGDQNIPAYKHLLGLVNSTDVQTAFETADQIKFRAENEDFGNEVLYAAQRNKPVFPTIEMQNLCLKEDLYEWNTFYEEGEGAMWEEIARVNFNPGTTFTGFILHYYKRPYGSGTTDWPSHGPTQTQTFTEVGFKAGVNDIGLGGGVAWGDYDNDGDLDLYVANAGSNNRLYRNNGASSNWSFTEAYPNAPIADPGLGKGVAWGDYDNDGDLDLALANYNEANGRFFRNDLDGSGARTFADVTQSARPLITDDAGAGLGVAWGDYDNDGYLDLYMTNEGTHPNAASTNKVNRLYHNNRDGTFTDLGNSTGIAADFGTQGSSRGAAWGDYDNDGDLDLYLATSIGEQNRLYRNDLDIDGSRRFNNVGGSVGVGDIEQGFGVAWGDYDNDGDLDLYVANGSGQENRLYQNDNAGTSFVNVGVSAKVNDTGEGQGVAWGDYDNDGDLDLYLTNVRGTNRLYQNNGDRTFAEVGVSAMGSVREDGRGAAWGDYDNDGDLDLYVVNEGCANRLYQNTAPAPNRFLTVKLVGTQSNRDGIGARVIAKTGTKQQRRDVDGGSGLFSQPSLPVEFGFGSTATVDELSIRWPSGTVQTLTNVATNQLPFFTVTEPNTPTGDNVSVSPSQGVLVGFETVALQGETTVSTTSEAPPTPFQTSGTIPFYDISTTAVVSGPIEVCITYSQPLNEPSLWHYGTTDGITGWSDITNRERANLPPNTVCGNVNSLSPFAVVEKPASTTTVTVEANFVRKGATTANKVPVDGARVVMLPKAAVQAHCNLLDATCGWANLAQINTAGDPVMTTANGSAVVTSSVADPNGWVIYIDIEGAQAAGATITGGTTRVGVANGDGAAQKKFTNILVADAAGLTATAITQRQQRITGSILEITYPDSVEWDGTDFLYPFIFTSDSEWEVNLCGSVPQGYRIVGDPCLQVFLANETKVSFFEVEEIGSPEPHLGLRGHVKHHGKLKTLNLEVPGKRKAKGRSKDAENTPKPTAYALHQAYPNPFNPTTQIAYQLPEPGKAELIVYDLMGQKVRALVQGHQEAGFYRVDWDGRDNAGQEVSSGVYFYTLEAGSFRETRRMVLVR
jgi:hypothetical protein